MLKTPLTAMLKEDVQLYSFPTVFIKDKELLTINAKSFLLENEDYYKTIYLDEVLYKPLLKVSRYSQNYKSDIDTLLAHVNSESINSQEYFKV